jgi:predicted ATPase/DNA-binding CsgD family transcriptional regulator
VAGLAPVSRCRAHVQGVGVGAVGAAVVATGDMHGFVPALTSFVGRDGEVAEVAGLLGEYRLVTVTGPGGAGKTRLAGEIASRVAGRFADGVWLAGLAAVRDPALVPAAVAGALGIREQPGVPTVRALAQVLGPQQLLLVLDNCEQVVAAVAGLCAGLMAVCDDMRILATSREPLRAAGETRYRLDPLALPGPGDAADVKCEAVELFADRARQADARFELDDQIGPTVARLVRRLDGIPLAIELAAAQVETLGVAQLLAHIDDSRLLAGGDRLAPSRQRSLAGAVEWSYRLLSPREQRVFRLLSLFPGAFSLEAAQAVAGEEAGPVVLRLVDCSLVMPPRTGPDGETRYVMLETLRSYGAGQLAAAGEQPDVAASLARYALGVAEQASAGLETSTAEVTAARRLDAEDAILQQALAWAADHDPATGARLAVAVAPWWFLRGRLAGERPRLTRAAEAAAHGSDTWCAAQFWLGYTALLSADLVGALEHFTALRDVGRVAGLAGRSLALAYLNRTAEAVEDGQHALARAEEAGDAAGQARALVNLSITAYAAEDFDRAAELARQAWQLPGDVPGSIARAAGNILTIVLTEAGDLAAARSTCAAGLARSRDTGDLWALARLLTQMAVLDLRAGRAADAPAHLQEALQVAWRTGGRAEVLDALDCCGHLCAATLRPGDAVTLWSAHAALARHEGHADWPPYARRRAEALRAARQALGPARTEVAKARGAEMTLATVTEYALLVTAADAAAPADELSPDQGRLNRLSVRERELVTLVARGQTDVQVAGQLFISVSTVRSHLDRIRDKTGCRRRADLTRLALSAGLV